MEKIKIDEIILDEELLKGLDLYIKDNYIEKPKKNKPLFNRIKKCIVPQDEVDVEAEENNTVEEKKSKYKDNIIDEIDAFKYGCSLDFETCDEEIDIGPLEDTFSVSLLKLIDAKGISDADCYNRVNIDRRLFSKIRSNVNYRPSKTTVLLFCVALELDIEQSNDLLKKAGFALSHSNEADVIVEYFIKNKIYNIQQIDAALLRKDQKTLLNY